MKAYPEIGGANLKCIMKPLNSWARILGPLPSWIRLANANKKVVSSEDWYSKFENQTKYLTTTCISFTVTVKVKDGQTTATNFKGVLLQARKGPSPDTATYYGTWDVLSSDLKTIN